MDKLEKALQKARQERKAHSGAVPVARSFNVLNYVPVERPAVTMPRVHVSDEQLERCHIVAHQTRSKEADIFRLLRTQVLQAMSQSGWKTLGVTSANYGDGKTTVSLNLAMSIALDLKQTVLLVDLDLRKPSVTEYLGIAPTHGLSDYFLRDVPVAECLVRPSFDRLTILPAGQPMDDSSEALGSPKIAALAHELKHRYSDRLVIYDMPPALAQDDPLAFLPHVDAVLLVVNDNVTKTSEVRQSMNVLAGTNVIGAVLNNAGGRKRK